MATIGFNNTRNVWTSKYTFETSMYSNINNRLYSYRTNVSPNDDIIYHQHNVGDTNTFYGAKSPSAISVSFNQTPSENKIFKSFSIEGTKNLAGIQSACIFETSYSLDQSVPKKSYTVGPLRYKGGIIYGYMGKDKSLKNGYVVNYVGTGTIENPANYTDEFDGQSNVFLFRSDNLNAGPIATNSSNPTKFLFSFPSQPQELYFLSDQDLQPQLVSEDLDYDDIPATLIPFPDADGNAVSEYGLAIFGIGAWVAAIASISGEEDPYVNLFAVSDPRIYGDFLRGQFAEAHISLGTQPFELYSLNLYYEPTPLDHSS